ncbi:hypothetical protein N7474_002575 [Penicillium riverlandense]|uniref:uncharacterized protein n=1 Tax=Penicillium riverlandense TaxID=1903569 RepID=UPI0025478CEB|nr:uncharacterized protein N7474_002575 [Penicillium riverlandense]KAJ5825437.1 hypothetical protein N7474_002575 [Penicillium riverlandense]
MFKFHDPVDVGNPVLDHATEPVASSLCPSSTREDRTAGQAEFSDRETMANIIPPPCTRLSLLLKKTFNDTYSEYCYTWGPILEVQDIMQNPLFSNSLLLEQALGVLGTRIKPPLVPCSSANTYFETTKQLFYGNYERNPLVRIMAIMLLYWWSGGDPESAGIEALFWWNTVAIRLAQQLGFHREPAKDHDSLQFGDIGLRRRIWWTLYARERLTFICTTKPCMIHPDDCNVPRPCVEDFPPNQVHRAVIFIRWVAISDIMERVGKYMFYQMDKDPPFPVSLQKELVSWAQDLPEELQLPFSNRTHNAASTSFDRDVLQLHMHYLMATTLVHMSGSGQQHLRKAGTVAILAASCTARICEEFLASGSLGFLPGATGRYISVALLSLLYARKIDMLSEAANEQIEILFLALKEMAKRWRSSEKLVLSLEKIVQGGQEQDPHDDSYQLGPSANGHAEQLPGMLPATPSAMSGHSPNEGSISDIDFFPSATSETTPLFKLLLGQSPRANGFPHDYSEWPDINIQLNGLFDQIFDDNYSNWPNL